LDYGEDQNPMQGQIPQIMMRVESYPKSSTKPKRALQEWEKRLNGKGKGACSQLKTLGLERGQPDKKEPRLPGFIQATKKIEKKGPETWVNH